MRLKDHFIIVCYLIVLSAVFNLNWNKEVESAELFKLEDDVAVVVKYTGNPFKHFLPNKLTVLVSNSQFEEWIDIYRE